jgi:hypothetical protein
LILIQFSDLEETRSGEWIPRHPEGPMTYGVRWIENGDPHPSFIGVCGDGGTYVMKRAHPHNYPRIFRVDCFKCGSLIDEDSGPDPCKRDEEECVREARRDVHRWAAMRSIILYGKIIFNTWLKCLEIVGHVADESDWMSINPWIEFLTERCKEDGQKRWYSTRIGELERHVTEANRYFVGKDNLMKMPTIQFRGHQSSTRTE